MNRLMILAAAATLLGVGKLTNELVADPPVDLQSATPGIAQVGHVNVSGTVRAGTFYGSSGGDTTKVVSGWATSPTGFVFGGDFRTNSVDGRGIFASALSTTGFNYGGDFRSASVNGRGIFGYATATIGPNIGGEFRTLSGAGRGVVGSALAATGTGIGVYGESTSPNGFAGYFDGRLNVTLDALVGGKVTAASFSGSGADLIKLDAGNVFSGTLADARLSANIPLLDAANQFTDSVKVASEVQIPLSSVTNSTVGHAVFGDATATTGNAFGGYFASNSSSGAGVYGEGLATTGSAIGGYFASYSKSGQGVLGVALPNTGNTRAGQFENWSIAGIAVYGWARAPNGNTYGVVGQCNSGYGVYSSGATGASGTKSFRIDHPSDPENKYLLHYSSEGPQPLNVYTGNVVTDALGEAWVQLPDYFGDINKEFRYTLTVVDDSDSDTFVIAKVARKIRENRFKIRTNAPRVEVTWRVEGVRNDLWVQKHGAPVEVVKDGKERGTYQHPDLYGMPEERGTFFQSERTVPPPSSSRRSEAAIRGAQK